MMRFLESVETVGTVYAKEVKATSMIFSVVPRSALIDIESALANVSWLQRTAPPFVSDLNALARRADLAIDYQR